MIKNASYVEFVAYPIKGKSCRAPNPHLLCECIEEAILNKVISKDYTFIVSFPSSEIMFKVFVKSILPSTSPSRITDKTKFEISISRVEINLN